jgi:hypothetical protein
VRRPPENRYGMRQAIEAGDEASVEQIKPRYDEYEFVATTSSVAFVAVASFMRAAVTVPLLKLTIILSPLCLAGPPGVRSST